MRFPIAIVSLALLTTPVRAYAQATMTPVSHNQTVSANPFGLMLNWLNVEYERKLSNTVTIGASASNFDVDQDDLLRGTLFVRFYPQGAALTGTYLGARASIISESNRGDSDRLFATGVELGRSWLMGSKRNIGFSVGVGMDRIFGTDGRATASDTIRAVPTFRLINVGIAF